MVKFSSYPTGTPSWVDLMSPDVDASAAFYSSVFGWRAEPDLDDEGNRIYTSFFKGDDAVAGMGGQPPEMAGMPAFWNSYIATDDAASITNAVAANGGTVTMPVMDVMDAGRMAFCADPTGASFAVWEAKDHPGAGVANEADTWSWNELISRDVETAKTFYSNVFGWTYDVQDMGPMGDYTVIEGGEYGGLGGMMAMPAEMPDQVPNHWMVYFMVDDVDATMAKVIEGGGQAVQETFDAPGVGRIAIAHDPHGGSFSLLQPVPQD